MHLSTNYQLPTTNYSKGFTLIEILLYVAITSLIFVGIITFMEVIFYVRSKQEIISQVEGNANLITETMTQNIRNAQNIIRPQASSTSQILNLTMKDSGISPLVIELKDGIIGMSEKGGATTSISSSNVLAKNLVFTNLGRATTPGAVRFEFTLQYLNPTSNPSYEYERRYIGGASLRPN